jgi:hypothetical protein
MKNVKFFLLFALFLSLLLSFVGCGGLRIESQNHKDDVANEHLDVNLEAAKLALEKAKFSLEVAKKSYKNETKEDGSSKKPGILVNTSIHHKVRFVFFNKIDGRSKIFIIGTNKQVFVELPIGEYKIIVEDQSPKGWNLLNTYSLEITNEANTYYEGVYYHFVLLDNLRN